MRVALVLTPYDQLAAYGFKGKRRKVYGYSLPLGIGYLAAILEKAGYEVVVLDPCPLRLGNAEIISWLKTKNPDYVGLSAMTYVAENAYALAREIRNALPEMPIVLGGSHCAVWPETVMTNCDAIDVVVIGEAEDRIVALSEAIVARNSELTKIPGLIFRDPKSGVVTQTLDNPSMHDLSSLPFPARHLFDNSMYLSWPDQIRNEPVSNLLTARGCSWRKCKFCFQSGKYMPRYRRRSPENVLAEMKACHEMGFKGISVWDDNFCVGEKWVIKFCSLLREANLGLSWTCCARADTITEKMIWEISSVGCFSIYFGFESGDQDILNLLNKGTTLEQIKSAVKMCHSYGVEVRGSFILGLPMDTPELARKTIKFAAELDVDSLKFMLYTPEPGTELYEIAQGHGQIIPRGFLGSLSRATYLPKGYKSTDELERIALRANLFYVLRPKFILRKLRAIRNWATFRRYLDGFMMMLSLRRS